MQPRQLIAVAALVSLLVAMPQPAQAHHRPSRYCSASGDICQSSRKHDGVRRLRIGSAARYFRVFHICVLDPRGYRFCAPFRLRERDDGTFSRSVRWRRHFAPAGKGAYTVSWWVGGSRIGRRLGFHVG
jgi:hypothetical protein